MTVYNQHLITSVFVGAQNTKSKVEDHLHNLRSAGDSTKVVAISCDECEPHLLREGWVNTPALVPLTIEQIAEKERMQLEGTEAINRMGDALAKAATQMASQPVRVEPTQLDPV